MYYICTSISSHTQKKKERNKQMKNLKKPKQVTTVFTTAGLLYTEIRIIEWNILNIYEHSVRSYQ